LGIAAPARAQAPGYEPGHVVALLPPAGTNVAPVVLEAARNILKDHLQRTGRYTVVTPAGAPTTEEPNAFQASQMASSVGATQAIVLQITHLGSTARARMTVYAVGTGQVIYWDSMPVTGGPDELDTVLQRLVHALVIGKPVRESAEIDTVTQRETQALARRNANRVFGVHLVAMTSVNAPDGEATPLTGAGLFWLYDARSWMADISLNAGTRQGEGGFADLSLGAYYPFSREDFTPYFGAAMKWAYLSFGGRGAGGLVAQPTFGILLGRLSTVQVRAQIGYFFSTFGERFNEDITTGVTSAKRFNHGFTANVGLGF
jgi:hypothetical protein